MERSANRVDWQARLAPRPEEVHTGLSPDRRVRPVSGMDDRALRQRRELLGDGASELTGIPAAKVGTADAPGKERVTREQMRRAAT